jgi:hypothetical protein
MAVIGTPQERARLQMAVIGTPQERARPQMLQKLNWSRNAIIFM